MMRQTMELRGLFLLLMVAAGVSFALCLASDVQMSIGHTSLLDEMAIAVAWLVGHGLHGALVVLLPVAYLLWQHSLPETGVEKE